MTQEKSKATNSITLPIGKTVDPFYNDKNIMEGIKVAPNMVESLLGNNVLDQESIQEIVEIVLVTKHRKLNKIPVEKISCGRSLIAADGSYHFFVQEGVKINRGQLVQPRARFRKR